MAALVSSRLPAVAGRIASPTNHRIKRLVRLRSRRERDRTHKFLIEGYRELLRAVEHHVALEEMYFSPELLLGKDEPALLEMAASSGAALFEVSDVAFRKAAYRARPEGLIGVAAQLPAGLDRIDPAGDPLLLVVESIEKPGNLGTMLRTAAAAGARGVVVCDPATDLFNPNVVRTSLGALFSIPVAVAPTLGALAWLQSNGIRILATTPLADRAYTEVDYRGACALVVGSEQVGLSRPWLEAAAATIRIPMRGEIDSLNAAMASGIVLFEAVRMRHGDGAGRG